MNRVRVEYAKAAITTLCAAVVLAVCIVGHTFEGAAAVVAFGAFTFWFVLRARVAARATARGCGQAPRP